VTFRIDAHQHFWQIAERRGAWPPPTLDAIYRDFGHEDLARLLAQFNVQGSVLVQSLPTHEDTEYLLDLSSRKHFVRAVVGWVDLKSQDAPSRVASLARHPKLRGIRPMLQDPKGQPRIFGSNAFHFYRIDQPSGHRVAQS